MALTLGSARPRIVCHIENHPRLHYGRAARWLLGRVAARVDAHIILSPSLREAAQPFLRSARRLEVIRPGIDLDRFDPAAVQPAGVRRLRGSASRVVGTVARLAEQKGIETLLDAMPRLLDAARTPVSWSSATDRAGPRSRPGHAASASPPRSTSSATVPTSR